MAASQNVRRCRTETQVSLVSSLMSLVQKHFNEEAARYDLWKKRNAYYYSAIKNLYREKIPALSSVLEIGCGTGDILAEVQPRRGVGIDISPAMIERARQKFPNLKWYPLTVSELPTVLQEQFDVIFLSDVIEHLEDVDRTIRDLRKFCHKDTRLIINMANPLWEPLLMALEKLHLKMPEGPHTRISVRTLTRIAERQGFSLSQRSKRLLFPMYIPLLSQLMQVLERLPILRSLCLIEVLEYRLRPVF